MSRRVIKPHKKQAFFVVLPLYENFQGNRKCYHHTCNMKKNKNSYHNTVCKTIKLITYPYTYYHKERKLQTEWRKRIGRGDGNWAVRDSNGQPNEYFFQQIKFSMK